MTGCGTPSQQDQAGGTEVVATTTIWADVARQVVQCSGSGRVTTLMPLGADPHDYSPSAKDVATMVGADLVVANGLGLEEGLASALESASQDGARVVEIAPQLQPIEFGAGAGRSDGDDHADGDGEADDGTQADDGGEHSLDPHVWLDANRVASAAALIGEELAELTGTDKFRSCGQEVEGQLEELHEEVGVTLARVPEERRVLITDHDAFGYFAEAYGYEVAGAVIPGGSTLAEPSSAEMAELAETLRSKGVDAIFANTANPQALVNALATEVGQVKVVDLFVGSLGGPGSGAEDYRGLMTTNAQRISEALSS
jgi:zinc/manganese transport system substrate-binding protein